MRLKARYGIHGRLRYGSTDTKHEARYNREPGRIELPHRPYQRTITLPDVYIMPMDPDDIFGHMGGVALLVRQWHTMNA